MDIFNFQNYITIHAILLICGVIFMFWRRPQRPFLLKMRAKTSTSHTLPVKMKIGVERRGVEVSRGPTLNIHFNFNGHSFDAYEVLGVPAGSSLDKVQAAYLAASEKSDATSRPFLQAALQAIESHLKQRPA